MFDLKDLQNNVIGYKIPTYWDNKNKWTYVFHLWIHKHIVPYIIMYQIIKIWVNE